MGDYLSPRVSGRPERRTRRGYALAVVAAGALLVVCAILPWAGLSARSDLIGAGVVRTVRGIDDAFGVYTLIAGLVAAGFGVAGLLTGRRPWAGLAALPGGVAAAVLVLFVTDPRGAGDRISVDLGGFLAIEPVLQYGWFAALGSALAVVVLAILSLLPRRP
ncbi:hypothetical protein ACIBEJ_22520 [Nonomuraea sp. NPDC050790]|uniref:hypothetical protein n=1 Tax=Nonomuraea sp. NPDC050790 TaxID=3364371 RepID=UPI003799E3F1